MSAVIVGLGYVGLPLAREAVMSGVSVVGYDVNQATVDAINRGTSHIDDISDEQLSKMLSVGFRATSNPADITAADVVVVCVPTPLNESGGPDLKYVLASMNTIADNIRRDTTVILESTTYPGTTNEVVLPIFESRGHVLDDGFFLAFSPERIDPGNKFFGAKNTPKVVGGVSVASAQQAENFYQKFVDEVVVVSGAREAELAKLLENTYRHVNIALVNEMVKFCHELGINFWDSIAAAATKPFGFQPFYPGPGVGGHCIPIDPNYLSHSVNSKLGYPFRFVELAQEINNSMPKYVAGRIQTALNRRRIAVNGSRVLLLGVTYKADIADQRESPSSPLARILMDLGAEVSFHDPYVEFWDEVRPPLSRVQNLDVSVQEADIVVLLQAHQSYELDKIAESARAVLDTRNAFEGADNVEKL